MLELVHLVNTYPTPTKFSSHEPVGSLDFFDARTASKFRDAKKDLRSVNTNNLDLPEGINHSLMKVYVLTITVHGPFQKTMEQEANTVYFLLLMVF